MAEKVIAPFWFLANLNYYAKPSTAWKVPKYGVVSGAYFPVFGLKTGKYRPEITPYLNTFHAVLN